METYSLELLEDGLKTDYASFLTPMHWWLLTLGYLKHYFTYMIIIAEKNNLIYSLHYASTLDKRVLFIIQKVTKL